MNGTNNQSEALENQTHLKQRTWWAFQEEQKAYINFNIQQL